MKTLTLLLAVIGLGAALSPNYEYKYRYNGRLATGIPHTRSQVAGTGIEFDVIVSMTSASEAIVKFSQIVVGEYHGDIDCDLRGKLPLKFQPMDSQYASILETPFHVNFLETRNKVMELKEEEPEWMTNIRKSVVNHLRIAPVRPTMGEVSGDDATKMIVSSDEEHPRSFTIIEDTILGRCPSQYTIVRLPEHFENKENFQLSQHIKEDAEFGPNPKEHLWRAVRSIDFDHCQDTVFLQHSGVGNASHIGRGKLDYIQSRTSVSQYILRGNQHHLRMERGINEGSYIMDTYGFTSQNEQLEMVTNQTMHLVSVAKGNSLSASGFKKQIDTWKYSVASPYQREGNQYNWVNFLNKGSEVPMNLESVVLGLPMNAQHIELYKAAFIKFFGLAVDEMMKDPEIQMEQGKPNTPFNTNSGKSAIYFHQASLIVQGLKEKQIREVFDHFYKGASGEKGDLYKMLIVDVIAASGTRDAAKVLLDKFNANEITGTRGATVFMTYANNIIEPELFKDVMQFVKTLDLKTRPYFASAALINFAQMAHRQCISEYHKNFTIPTPVLGDHMCTKRQVLEELLPFLKEKLEASSTPWEKAIYVQAIGNLGTPEVIEILRPYIYGEKERNPAVRNTAMYALTSWKMPPIVRREVFDTLMKIVDNVGEHSEVRQRAIKVMLSWQPDASWWQRLAALTWHNLSRKMQHFISSTIHNTAYHNTIATGRQTHYAKNALPLVKPVVPTLRYSYNARLSEFNRPSELMTEAELSWMTNSESVFPKDLDAYFMMRLGGFDYRMFDIVLQADGIQENMYDFFDKVRNLLEPTGTENIKNAKVREANDIYQKFLDAVQMENYKRSQPEGMIFTKVFDNMQQYFQLNSDVFNKYLAGNPTLIKQMIEGKRIHLTKYLNPVTITTAVASEVGLPVIGTTIAPTIVYTEGKVKLTVEGQSNPTFYELVTSKKIDLDVEVKHKFVTKATTILRALVPWTQRAVATGIDSERQVNLPIKARLEVSRKEVDKYVKFTVTPTQSTQIPILYARNVPFTAFKSMWQNEDMIKSGDFKPLYVDLMKKQPLNHIEREFGMDLTGLKMKAIWDGDVDYPFQLGDIYEFFKRPERLFTTALGVDARQWRYGIFIDPSSSKTKQINLKASIIPSGNDAGAPVKEPISVEDSNVKRYQKTKAMIEGTNFENFGAARVELAFTGSENRKYDAGMSWYTNPTAQLEKTKIVAYALRTQLPQYSPSPKSICVLLEGESPVLTRYVEFDQILKRNPHIKLHSTIFAGNANCMEKKAVDATVDLKLSEERKAELEFEATHTSCTMHKFNNTCNGFPIDAVYDRAHAKIDYDQNMPKYLKNATFVVADVARGFFFPQVYFNYMDVNNPEGHIEITAERPLESHYWKIWSEMPHTRSIVEKVVLPEIVDEILPIGGMYMPAKRISQIFMGEPVEKNKCVIYQDKVRTYDAYTYEAPALPCWTVAAHDRAHEKTWVLETRFINGHFEARITSVNRGTIIEMKEGEVKVNGAVHKPAVEEYILDAHHRVAFHILNRNGKYVVEMPNKLSVFMHHGKVEVMTGYRYKGQMSGLCGDFNLEHKFDLQGPKHCLYDQKHYNTYYKSWVSEQTDCPKFAEYKSEVANFQKTCVKAFEHDYMPERATHMYEAEHYGKTWIYNKIQLEKKVCISETPVSRCDKSYKRVVDEQDIMVTHKCWYMATAPASIKQIMQSPQPQTLPVAEQPDFFMSLPVHNEQCMRK